MAANGAQADSCFWGYSIEFGIEIYFEMETNEKNVVSKWLSSLDTIILQKKHKSEDFYLPWVSGVNIHLDIYILYLFSLISFFNSVHIHSTAEKTCNHNF